MLTVLLVDDDRLVLGYCYNVLTARPDFQVMQCTSGDDAAELASLYAGKIDLLISDICMPGRLNGIALAQELTAMRPEAKILLMSGRANEPLPLLPSWQFIAKPFRPSDLLSKIEAMLHLPAATSVRR
jgi:DNA-binding NtrC family response regulator